MASNIKPDEIIKLEKYYDIYLDEAEDDNLFQNQYKISNGKVTAINLSNNAITDVDILKCLDSLEELDLSDNFIKNIDVLKYLKSLKALHLGSNKISNIQALSNLYNLTALTLSNNKIQDLRPIENLKSLQNLNLGSNSISDMTPLLNLGSLEELDLGNNLISNIDSIKLLTTNLTNLQFLYIDANICFEDILDLDFGENHLITVKNYFAKLQEKPDKIKMPVKVMLIGNHGTGKSTFLNGLLGANNTTDSTHILRIENFPKNTNNKLPQAIFFDFGGQDYYHGIYKAFMTNDAINVIF